MKSFITRGIAFFLFGIMIMQVLFTGGSKKAAADHSENATLVTLPSVMTMYMANTTPDPNAPAPFNGSVSYGIYAGGLQDAKKNYYEICYCIGYSKIANASDALSSKTELASSLLTTEQATLINTAILLGYNKENVAGASLTVADKNAYWATQALVWIMKEGYFYDDAKRTAAENFFFNKMPSIKTNYTTLYNKVKAQVATPSFVNKTENVMKYNATTKKYELTLTNTTSGALTNAKVDTASLPSGVTATINGDKLELTSTNAITTAFKVKVTKAVNAKGRIVAWKNTSGDKQPQVSIDYDLDPLAQEMEVICKTEAAVATPAPTVEPTKAPTTGSTVTVAPSTTAPCDKGACDNTFETKEIGDSSKQMDASPKTADESCVSLAYKLIGASLFTMISLYIVSIINKRKQRF